MINTLYKHSRAIFIALAAIAIFSASMLATVFLFDENRLTKEEKEFIKNAPPSTVNPEKDYQSIVLAGYGGADHPGGGLADSITQIILNKDNKKALVIAIPRDTNVSLPIRSDRQDFKKINDSFAIGNSETLYPLKQNIYSGKDGGGKLLKVAVGKVTGVNPDYYAAISFTQFTQLIDDLEGITVDVPVSFTDEYFPTKGKEDLLCGKSPQDLVEIHQKYSGFELEKQFKCRYETLSFTAGETQMNGETALKFIRSRHSDNHGGDFARGERAQAVLAGIFQKLLSIDALKNIDKHYINFSKLVRTDLGLNDAKAIAQLVQTPQNYEIIKINLTKDNFFAEDFNQEGQYILNPKQGIGNFSQIHKHISDNIN